MFDFSFLTGTPVAGAPPTSLSGVQQLIVGGLLISAGTFLLGSLRSIPGRILNTLETWVSTVVELTQNDSHYRYFSKWLQGRKGVLRFGTLGALEIWERDTESYTTELITINGTSVFIHNKHLFVVNTWMKELDHGMIEGKAQERRMSIRVWPRSKSVMMDTLSLTKDDYCKRTTNMTKITFMSNDSIYKNKRPSKSVCLADGMFDAILADAEAFLAGKERYNDLGVPWHRGYMFHGPPGNGKTSAILALAGELNMNVYTASLSGMTDRGLQEFMLQTQQKSIIVFEDIDSVLAALKRRDIKTETTRKKQTYLPFDKDLANVLSSEHGVSMEDLGTDDESTEGDESPEDRGSKMLTLSGILNVFDGLASQEGNIIIVTSNVPNTLDAAFLRPGRIDRKWYFGNGNDFQVRNMLLKVFPNATEDEVAAFVAIAGNERYSMSNIQHHLMSAESSRQAIENPIVTDVGIDSTTVA